MDALHLDGDLTEPLSSAACFAGAMTTATMIYAGDDCDARLDLVRDLICEYSNGHLKAAQNAP